VQCFPSTFKLKLELDQNRKQRIAPQQMQRELSFWIEGSLLAAGTDFMNVVHNSSPSQEK